MKNRTIFTLLAAFCMHLAAWSQTIPTINPQFTYTDDEGQEQTTTSASESAPLVATFTSGTENAEGWEAHYEWHFYKDGKRSEPYLIRYDETTDYTFTQAGTHFVELYAIFTQGTDTVAYTEEYWTSEGAPLSISISESKLNMPNAFSPNGDGINDIYKAKEGYQSIVEFHAYIFNRWGQKLYEWTDPAGGWDGKYKGKGEDIPEGEAMARYAINKGIDESKIIIEDKSTNTKENLLFSSKLMIKESPRVGLVTTSYHVFRALILAKDLGIRCIGFGSVTKWYFTLNALIREFIGYLSMTWKKHVIVIILYSICIVILSIVR